MNMQFRESIADDRLEFATFFMLFSLLWDISQLCVHALVIVIYINDGVQGGKERHVMKIGFESLVHRNDIS